MRKTKVFKINHDVQKYRLIDALEKYVKAETFPS